MQRSGRKRVWSAALALAWAVATGGASAATLDRIGHDRMIRIAYREDAPPFSSKDKDGAPSGYLVDLCRAVAKHLGEQLNLTAVKLAYLPVNAVDRFAAIASGKADLLCEPTTETLARRQQVDFSIPTFVDGAGLLIRSDGPRSLKALAGRKIGVLAGTTTEDALHNTLKDAGIAAEVIPAKTHQEGLTMLDDGRISAYFADRSILIFLTQQSKAPAKLLLAENYLTVEPYALALPRGDEDFRLAVDRALSHIYRSGEIVSIFARAFGGKAKPSGILETLYLIAALPD
jgi:polar amino acid transport system substrate-binding protein/glutamate/aspartate transport system substrate-binding protein